MPFPRPAPAGSWLLSFTVFLAGAVVLIVELLGPRVLAPLFGSSHYVWTALIAVTLLALAAGYRAGGSLADRTDPWPALYRVLPVAGWLVLAVPWLRVPVLPLAAELGLRGGAVVAALILFAPALLLLGAVAPLAARAAVLGLDTLGVTVGSLYALSTVGSVAGALVAGFWLVPLLGVPKALSLSALGCFAPAAWYWWRRPPAGGGGRRFWRLCATAGLLVSGAILLKPPPPPLPALRDHWSLLWRTDSHYADVRVVQYGAGRVLLLDGTLQTGVELGTRTPMFPYAGAAAALLRAAAPEARRALLIGFGGGTLAELLDREGLAVTGVEIDEAVTAAARRFFLERPMDVVHADGRLYLARGAPGAWDIVILDAYAAEAPPSHLFTLEAYRLVRRALAPGGVGLANLISVPRGPEARLARCVAATLRAVFPWVEAYAVEEGDLVNVLYLFSDRPRRLVRLPSLVLHPQVAASYRGLLDRRLDLTGPDAFVLTDDHCPLERLGLPARERMRAGMRALLPAWLLLSSSVTRVQERRGLG